MKIYILAIVFALSACATDPQVQRRHVSAIQLPDGRIFLSADKPEIKQPAQLYQVPAQIHPYECAQ
jgi:hypothetical protein